MEFLIIVGIAVGVLWGALSLALPFMIYAIMRHLADINRRSKTIETNVYQMNKRGEGR